MDKSLEKIIFDTNTLNDFLIKLKVKINHLEIYVLPNIIDHPQLKNLLLELNKQINDCIDQKSNDEKIIHFTSILSHCSALHHYWNYFNGQSVYDFSLMKDFSLLISQGCLFIAKPVDTLPESKIFVTKNKGTTLTGKELKLAELRYRKEQQYLNENLLLKPILNKFWQLAIKTGRSSKKIFISYAWPIDNEDLSSAFDEKWTFEFVKLFTSHLVLAGFQVYLDVKHSGFGFPLDDHMIKILEVDHILVISTQTMKLKLARPESGVSQENNNIKLRLGADPNSLFKQRLVIPILLNKDKYCDELFHSLAEVSFYDGYFKALSELINRLYNFEESIQQNILDFEAAILQSHLNLSYTNPSTLSIKPITEHIKSFRHSIPIADNYSDLTLIKVDEEQQKSKAQHPTLSSNELPVPSTLVLLNNIYHENQLTKPGSGIKILITGAAGMGKSTLGQYILYQLASGQLWAGQFSIYLKIHCRDLNKDNFAEENDCTLINVIKKLCFNELKSHDIAVFNHLEHLLEHHTERSLFILDGADELPEFLLNESNHPLRKTIHDLISLPNVIVTTRPMPGNILGFNSTVNLQTIGFNRENINKYINNFFKSEKHKAISLSQLLNRHSYLQNLAQIPINLELICELWQENQRLFENLTITELYNEIAQWLFRRYYYKEHPHERNTSDETINKTCYTLSRYLEDIAWQASKNQVSYLSESLLVTSIRRVLKSNRYDLDQELLLLRKSCGFLKSSDQNVNYCHFLHLTFQDYFAARFIANAFTDKNDEILSEIKLFLIQNKYNPRFEVLWWFVAGLLKNQTAALQHFFNDLLEPPRDIVGLYEICLLTRCMEEANLAKKIAQQGTLLNDIKEWFKQGITLRKWTRRSDFPLLQALRLSPQLTKIAGFTNDSLFSMRQQEMHPLFSSELFQLLDTEKDNQEKIAELLNNALYDTTGKLKELAPQALAHIAGWGQGLPPSIINDYFTLLLYHSTPSLGKAAETILKEICTKNPEQVVALISLLTQALEDNNNYVRTNAVNTCAKLSKYAPCLTEPMLNKIITIALNDDMFDLVNFNGRNMSYPNLILLIQIGHYSKLPPTSLSILENILLSEPINLNAAYIITETCQGNIELAIDNLVPLLSKSNPEQACSSILKAINATTHHMSKSKLSTLLQQITRCFILESCDDYTPLQYSQIIENLFEATIGYNEYTLAIKSILNLKSFYLFQEHSQENVIKKLLAKGHKTQLAEFVEILIKEVPAITDDTIKRTTCSFIFKIALKTPGLSSEFIKSCLLLLINTIGSQLLFTLHYIDSFLGLGYFIPNEIITYLFDVVTYEKIDTLLRLNAIIVLTKIALLQRVHLIKIKTDLLSLLNDSHLAKAIRIGVITELGNIAIKLQSPFEIQYINELITAVTEPKPLSNEIYYAARALCKMACIKHYSFDMRQNIINSLIQSSSARDSLSEIDLTEYLGLCHLHIKGQISLEIHEKIYRSTPSSSLLGLGTDDPLMCSLLISRMYHTRTAIYFLGGMFYIDNQKIKLSSEINFQQLIKNLRQATCEITGWPQEKNLETAPITHDSQSSRQVLGNFFTHQANPYEQTASSLSTDETTQSFVRRDLASNNS